MHRNDSPEIRRVALGISRGKTRLPGCGGPPWGRGPFTTMPQERPRLQMVSRPPSRRHRVPAQGQRVDEGGREHFASVGHKERLRMSQFLTEYNRRALRASFPAWAVSSTRPAQRYFRRQKRQRPVGSPRGSIRPRPRSGSLPLPACDRITEVRGRIAPWSEPLAAPPTALFDAGRVDHAGMCCYDHLFTR